jgi:hypothetical protein
LVENEARQGVNSTCRNEIKDPTLSSVGLPRDTDRSQRQTDIPNPLEKANGSVGSITKRTSYPFCLSVISHACHFPCLVEKEIL